MCSERLAQIFGGFRVNFRAPECMCLLDGLYIDFVDPCKGIIRQPSMSSVSVGSPYLSWK